MANQVAARLKGDDYQHLYSWFHVLELLMPQRQVAKVIVEDEGAGSIDDVAVHHEKDSDFPDCYHQVKYHVDQRSAYSVDRLTEKNRNGKSLIQKWYHSWKGLIEAHPEKNVEVHIVSNWSWAENDVIGTVLSGETNALTENFFDTHERKINSLRQTIYSHLGDESKVVQFARSLRFQLGYSCWKQLADQTAERMEHRGLRSDGTALLVSVSIVREWIKARRQEINVEVLDEVLETHALWLPADVEPAVHVYLTTIKTQKFEIEPDYVIDWRDYFKGGGAKKGHDLKNPQDWNEQLLPDLEAIEGRINTETDCRLIRARGQARLSAWFAFGFTFSEVNRYTIEIAQGEELWRSDVKPACNFCLITNGPEGEELQPDGSTVAIGISVTGELDEDVRIHLKEAGSPVRALLLLKPNRELGADCLRNAPDAVALAQEAKKTARHFVKHHRATRLLLYYFGPLSGACFIGHQFNAVCKEVVIMERSEPTYARSFALS